MKTSPLLLAIFAFVVSANGAEPTTAPERDPSEIRHGIPMSGTPEERSRAVYERIISKVEPSLRGDVNNLGQYLDLFKREFIEDPRNFACEFHFDITGDDKATITGYLEFPEHKAALAEFFKHLKLTGIEDQTELLPAAELGERKYAVVKVPRTFVYDKPDGKRETLTECLQGETIYLLKSVSGQFLCHAPSGYVGFIDPKDVRVINGMMLDQVEGSLSVQHGSQIETVLAAADKFKGTKYVWGGITTDGVDCSGIICSAFRTIGITLPRDADQQALVGRLVATRWHRSGLRRGDTLYFLSRRGLIHHTAIYLGDNKFLEATEPVTKISSFNPKDPDYSEKRDKSFCFAKRVLE